MNGCRFLILLLFATSPLFSQKSFYKTYGHITQGSEGRNVAEAADGGFFHTYYIYFNSKPIACVTKINCGGIVEWEKFYDGGNSATPTQTIPQADNGCIVSVSVRTFVPEWKVTVMRLDAAGNTMWTQNILMQAANATGGMVQGNDSSIYVCGSVTFSTGMVGSSVAKISKDGILQWQRRYQDNTNHTPIDLTISGNKIAVCGYAPYSSLPFTNVFVYTCNSNDGTFIKRKVFGTTYDDETRGICSDESGNFYVIGFSYFIATNWDMMLLKLDNNLNMLQSKFIDAGGSQGEQARYITKGKKDGVTVFGDEGGFNERNPVMIQADENCNVVFAKRYPVSPNFTNYLFHGNQCSDGGYIMTGDARPAVLFRIAPFIKTDSLGNAGCYTSEIGLNVRNEVMTDLDIMLQSINIPLNPDVSPLPYSTSVITTNSISFCSGTLPCGTFSHVIDSLCPDKCFTFNEQSYQANNWLWTFEGGIPSTFNGQVPPAVCFPEPGLHTVTLTLENITGNVTTKQVIDATTSCEIFIPNVFTPGTDDFNDVFRATGINEDFTLKIFNRWGNEVFSSSLPGQWWNGDNAVEGVYFYLLHLPESNRKFHGTVHLMR